MKIFLIRHGEAIKTDTDSVLTKKGVIQAKNVAKVLKEVSLSSVFTSNLTRSKQTLEEYKKINPSIKININEDLNEIYRVIVGGPIKKGTPKDRERKDISRANNFFKNMITIKEGNIAVFTHGNIIKFFLAKVLEIDPIGLWSKMVISPGSISIVEVAGKSVQVKATNIYGHQIEFFEEFFKGNVTIENYLP